MVQTLSDISWLLRKFVEVFFAEVVRRFRVRLHVVSVCLKLHENLDAREMVQDLELNLMSR